MKRAHTVTLSVFVAPDEQEEPLIQQLKALIPFDLAEEKIALKRTVAAGFNDRKIVILELVLSKERHTNAFLDHLAASLSGAQKQQLVEQTNRLDEHLDFFLRLRKGDLPLLVLTDGGDCIHVRISLAAFPKKEEVARALVKEIFK